VRKSSIATVTIGILAIIVLLRAVDLWFWRTQVLAAADARAADLARILSEYTREWFAAGDASLRQLAIHSRRIGGPEASDTEWAPILASAHAALHGVGAISIGDAAGTIRHSTQPAIVGQSRASTYIFRRLIDESSDELIVDTPYRSPLDNKTYLIPIGRRLTDPSGSFKGAVVATYLPDAPRGFFRTVDLGDHGFISVLHPDGYVVFREPSSADPIGLPASGDAVFEAAKRGNAEGIVHGPLAPHGRVFLTAYRATMSPPLYVAVSLERSDVLAAFQRQILGSALFFIVLATTLIVTLRMLFRQMDARESANKQLAAALALKDEFLMTVSHELRTPLNAIQGWTRVLMAGELPTERVRMALETIDRNTRAQTRLVDDLLDVSRGIGGKLRLDVHPVQLPNIVRDVVETSRPAAEAKAIELCWTSEPTHPVRGDHERLQQVAWNLLSNAIKFTPERGRVDVSVRNGAGSFVTLVVGDTGAGIANDFLPHVFEPFLQGETGPKRRYGGLGLGLAIVRTIVELHGGTVTAASEGEGRGATFTVQLPMA
jgi:signal transduction histidine kinase